MTRAIIVKREGAPVVAAQGAALYSSMLAQTKGEADAAAASAEAAKSAGGVGEFANTAAGLAGTEIGQTFWVDNGDGTGTTYRHDAGPVATQIGKFIKDPTDSGAANLLAGGVPTTAALLSTSGTLMIGTPRGGNLEQDLAALASVTAKVGTPADFEMVADTTSVKLSGGMFVVWDGSQYTAITGPSTQQTVSLSATDTAIVIDENGDFSAVSIIGARQTPVAYVRDGSLVEVIGRGGASGFGVGGGDLPNVPQWPPCIRRLARYADDYTQPRVPVDPELSVAVSANGALDWSCGLDVTDFTPTTGDGYTEYWINVSSGSDSNDGSESTPFKSFGKALTMSGDLIIYVDGGGGALEYDRQYGWNGSVTNRSIAVIGINGTPVLTAVDHAGTWVSIGDGVYTQTRSSFGAIVDETHTPDRGRPNQLYAVSAGEVTAAGSAKAAVIAAVGAQGTGAYYIDGSNLITAMAFDGRSVIGDSSFKIIMDLTNGRVAQTAAGTMNVYLENIGFKYSRGFQTLTQDAQAGINFYCKDVSFGQSYRDNSLNLVGGVFFIIDGGTHEYGYRDVLNYHSTTIGNGGGIPVGIEVDVTSRYAGFAPVSLDERNDNASTMHDGGFVLRFKGTYSGTTGPVVHDVHEGTESVLIASLASDNVHPTDPIATRFACGQTGILVTTAQYLLDCRYSGTGNTGFYNFVPGNSRQFLWRSPLGSKPQPSVVNPCEFLTS